jgi:hypothetical protein
MTLTVLLILAGFAATDEAPSRATTAANDEATSSASAPAAPARRDSFFEAVRKKIAVGRPTPLLIPNPSASPSPDPAESGQHQLTNRRTGVTCTLRIVPMRESVDPGAVAGTGGGRPDPIVRNDVSPCVDGGGAINAGRRR